MSLFIQPGVRWATPGYAVGLLRSPPIDLDASAIHDQRMVDDDGKNVTISQWDYRNDKYVRETMSGQEFVERFALHIVPRSVHRVRYAGLFQGKGRTETLAKVRDLIAQHQASPNRRLTNLPMLTC